MRSFRRRIFSRPGTDRIGAALLYASTSNVPWATQLARLPLIFMALPARPTLCPATAWLPALDKDDTVARTSYARTSSGKVQRGTCRSHFLEGALVVLEPKQRGDL